MILENDRKKLAPDKKLAVHRFLQSITRMDYQSLNKPIRWEDNSGEHTGFYHPMDFMHCLIKNLDIPSRGKLYQKLSICKLALPVLFPNKDQFFMDVSLRQVKIAWMNGSRIEERDVINATVPIISMIRCGQQSSEMFSKSKLANDLLKFRADSDFGTCGFFTKDSLSSNNARKISEGTVEGMWFESTSNDAKFPASFGLLNLRGNCFQNMETATTLASISDVVFIFCDADILKDDCYKNMLQETAGKLKIKDGAEKKIKKLVVIYTKDARHNKKKIKELFTTISETVELKKVVKDYKAFLKSINETILESLNKTSKDPIATLSARLRQENKESTTVNFESAKYINDLFIKIMDKIKKVDKDQRSAVRESIFPLQSTTKYYAETQRKENRSLDIDMKTELSNELMAIREGRYKKIQRGLPEPMSSFLKELFRLRTLDQKLMFVSNIQYGLDDWCSKNLSEIRMKYLKSLEQLTSLKEKAVENKKNHNNEERKKESIAVQTEWCKSLSKSLLDMSVGIESIFREIGEICETTKKNESSLIKELNECNKKLPEVAAKLLLKGVAIELMDGDGLSVPTAWLEEVMKALNKQFKDILKIKMDPKIFVLTVLGTQSTGKSTLLNTMFGVQFPVSAGRCTKGAFMQLIPIVLKNFPYDGLLIVDTEGLGAPEFKEDNRHDNEIATFVLGISDLAIINVRGEHPTNIENFLQVSTCALMRMSMVDFHPSVIFVHQNCDPSAKQKNTTDRYKFMKQMDEVVCTHARLIQKQDLFSCFQDVVDISLADEKNDFAYFPQLYEGSPPMSPPNGDYSKACSKLTINLLSKMKTNFEKHKNAQTLENIAKKIKLVWKGVLEENFVLSLINAAEIQVKYDVDNYMSNCKVKMESHMEDILEDFCRVIEADFKAKKPSTYLLADLKDQLEVQSHATNSEQVENFTNFIQKQTLNLTMYKNWQQKSINKMNKIRESIVEDCQRRISAYSNHEKNYAEWKVKLQQSKKNLQDHARQIANDLLRQKEEKAGENVIAEFSDDEIECKFQEFWSSVKHDFNSKKETTFAPANVQQKFSTEIALQYGHVTTFNKISSKFGLNLQNTFKIEWINFSHVEFSGNTFYRCVGYIGKKFSKTWYKQCGVSEQQFLRNMRELIGTTEDKLSKSVLSSSDFGGLIKMKLQSDSTIFHCGSLVKQYLTKAIGLLVETHEESQQRNLYNLTSTFKAMFLFYAAQIAIPQFQKAQQSFLNYMDISTKLDSEREDIKQIFTLILKNEGTLTIAAKQVTKRLQNAIRKAVLKQVRTPCKKTLLRLVSLKLHVHGLVLYDVMSMLDNNMSEETVNYLQEYFRYPFKIFRKKILHVFEGCSGIRLNDLIQEKFASAIRKTKVIIEKDLKPSNQHSLIEVICQNSYIRSLGLGEADFDGIIMPEYEQDRRKEVEKRMDDETEIIKRLKSLISETHEINTDITLTQQLEIKHQVIDDVSNHLFQCVKTCPLCCGPCNETHVGGLGPHSPHKCHCHRPQGFAGYVVVGPETFATTFCNEDVKTDRRFKNAATNMEYVYYKNYSTVNDYYKSWDIKSVTSDDSLYWKYITYQITKHLDRFFPEAKQPEVSAWSRISKSEAIKNIISLFHLDENTIAKNKDGFHYIKT